MVFRRFWILGTAAPVTSDFKASLSLWKFPFAAFAILFAFFAVKPAFFTAKNAKV
jgi:hypothetical protein